MSPQLLRAMEHGLPYHQGPLDDAESFLNCALWAVVFNTQHRDASGVLDKWRQNLRGTPADRARAQAQMLGTLEWLPTEARSPLLMSIHPLLMDWRKKLDELQDRWKGAVNNTVSLEMLHHVAAYRTVLAFVQVYSKHIPAL